MRKKKNREKYSSFSEFILNDDKVVMPLLLNISMWFGVVMFMMLSYIMFKVGVPFLGVIFLFFVFFGLKKIYKTYKVGGVKNMDNMTASNLVWNKKKIKVGKNERK